MKKKITLDRSAVNRGALILVNADHPLRGTDEKNLTFVDMRFPDIMLQRSAVNVLQMILQKISAGDAIIPVSGYRSSQEQTAIYQQSLRENGEVFTKKYVALPDQSEHQTGLAIDLGLNRGNIDFICPDFPYEGICDAFRRMAPDYGFVERYAQDKEKITGISHEPWHFRYVGIPHAEIMTREGLVLEEYIDFIRQTDLF